VNNSFRHLFLVKMEKPREKGGVSRLLNLRVFRCRGEALAPQDRDIHPASTYYNCPGLGLNDGRVE